MLKLKDGYYAKDSNNEVYYYEIKPSINTNTWAIDGNFECNILNCIEITEPWDDSLYYVKDGVATKVVTFVKDQKVLVRDKEDNPWVKRYYSHETNGKHYVFINGQTSWTTTDTCRFKYVKPYIEGEDD